MDVLLLQDYHSSAEEDTQETQAKKPRADINCQKIKTFNNSKSAEEYILREECWAIRTSYVGSCGYKIIRYRCNKTKARGEQCLAVLRLIHNHSEILEKSRVRFDEKIRNEIKNIFDTASRIKPKKVLEILQQKEFTLPTKTQIKNLLSWLRRKKFGSCTVSLRRRL